MSLFKIVSRSVYFSLVGVFSFAIWAFCSGIFQNTASLYSACAIIFILFGGLALLPYSNMDGGGVNTRILWIFPIGFLIYAGFWCLGWFTFRNHFGEIMGSAVGIIALTAVFKWGLGFNRSIFEAAAVVFSCYTIGYYLGEKAAAEIPGIAGKLLWGWGLGLGMGVGLSYLVSLVQVNRY